MLLPVVDIVACMSYHFVNMLAIEYQVAEETTKDQSHKNTREWYS